VQDARPNPVGYAVDRAVGPATDPGTDAKADPGTDAAAHPRAVDGGGVAGTARGEHRSLTARGFPSRTVAIGRADRRVAVVRR